MELDICAMLSVPSVSNEWERSLAEEIVAIYTKNKKDDTRLIPFAELGDVRGRGAWTEAEPR